MVEGGNGGVRAVTLGLWRESEDDDPCRQSAQTNDDRQHPGARGVGDRPGSLAERRGGDEAGEPEEELGPKVQRNEEQRSPETADDADGRAEHDPLTEVCGRADAKPQHSEE